MNRKGLCVDGFQDFLGMSLVGLCLAGNLSEVTPKHFQREFFPVNFASRPNTHSPEHRNGRTPTLHRVLEQKTSNN